MSSAALQIISQPWPSSNISESAKKPYQTLLTLYSQNSFEDDDWHITLTASAKQGWLHYPTQYSLLEIEILKATILTILSEGQTLNFCSSRIHDACLIFDYLASNNISFSHLNQAVIDNFYSYLGDSTYENWHRNRYLQTFQTLAETGETLGALTFPAILNFSRRWNDKREPKHAPETAVVSKVDQIFFNLNSDVPLGYRVMYLTLRLRTHRISEVIAIPIDCISYPQENTFAISVPTEKETPYHIPVFHKYNFLINGMCESIYYKMLIQQRDYAASMQEKLSTPYKGYLFVHPSLPRLITTADFNKFLSKICTENHVIDSEGNPAVITSHDLRHINVCERLQGNTISAFDTMVECNHSSLTQTLGYGYPSKKDSTDHLADITKQLPLLKDDKEIECLKMPQFKYSKLLEDSSTKVIPGYGICRNLECEPQFEKCLQCESFSPDPQCREYFLSAIDFLRKRNEKIIKKNGDQAVVQRNAQSIQLYQNCINKMDAASASRKGSAS